MAGLPASEHISIKDSYRTSTITTPIDVAASNIIPLVKRKNLTIIGCDIERNYEESTTITRLSVRLFHNGITDKLAHGLLDSLEKSKITLKSLKWDTS